MEATMTFPFKSVLKLLFVICLMTGLIVLSGFKSIQYAAIPIETITSSPSSMNRITVYANLTDIAPEGMGFRLSFGLEGDDISERLDMMGLTPKHDLVVLVNGYSFNFEKDQVMPTQEIKLPWIKNGLRAYPFDQYVAQLDVSVFKRNETIKIERIPVTLKAEKLYSGFELTISNGHSEIEGEVIAIVNIKRSVICILWTIHTFFVNWMVTGTVVSLTVVYSVRHPVSPMVMNVSLGFLYSLSVVRDSLFQAPPVGIDIDLFGFIWNVLIVSICVMKLIISYVIQLWLSHISDLKEEEYIVIL